MTNKLIQSFSVLLCLGFTNLLLVSCGRVMTNAVVGSLALSNSQNQFSSLNSGAASAEMSFKSTAVGVSNSSAVVLQNSGSIPITITSVTLASGSAFSLPTFKPVTLPPKGGTSIQVNFVPNQIKVLNDTLTVHYTNGATEFEITIALSGEGSAPANLICSEVSGSSANLPFGWGSGTAADPYVICSPEQMNQIAINSAYLQSYFVVGADLDFSNTNFVPIGNGANAFSGSFDGNNHTISNITSNDPTWTDPLGFFSNASGAIVKNLNLVNITMVNTLDVGLLFGTMSNVTVSNINLQGSVSGVANSLVSRLGGLAGYLNDASSGTGSTISNISINANVSGDDSVAAVIGQAFTTMGAITVFDHVVTSGLVSARAFNAFSGNTFGGLISYLVVSGGSSLAVSDTHIANDINEYGAWSGGFVGTGSVQGGSSFTVTEDSYTGNITTAGISGPTWANGYSTGGMFGTLGITASTFTVAKSFATGNVTDTQSNNTQGFGNFIGYFTLLQSPTVSFTDCYTSGNLVFPNMTGVQSTGNFIGYLGGDSSWAASQLAFNRVYTSGGLVGIGGGSNGGFIGSGQWLPYSAQASYFNSSLNGIGIGDEGNGSFGGLTTAMLATASNFIGYDFTNVWTIVSGGFPSLR